MTMTRRKKMMIAAISIAGAILFTAISVLSAAAILGRTLTVTPSRRLENVDSNIENALWYSSLAANSHNAQALKIKLFQVENRLEIRIDETRTLSVVDPKKREAYLSLGCYLETAVEAFSAFGFDTAVTYEQGESGFFANVLFSLRENADVDESKLSLIEKRRTDKSAYASSPIKQEHLSSLIEKYPSIHCYQNGEENFEYLKKGTLSAVTAQSANQAYRDELAAWLRFSDQQAREKLDGITAEMMGLNGIIKTFYYWTTNAESAKGDQFANQGISTAKKQVENCGAFFTILGGDTQKELVEAGRTLQRFWLDCAKMDVSLQPMSAILETQPFADLIQEELKCEGKVQMILRAGYVKEYGKNIGLRRNLSDYIQVMTGQEQRAD